MGLILITPKPNKSYWIMSDPHFSQSFLEPTRAKFVKAEYIQEDNVYLKDKYEYTSTYFFDGGIKIPAYNTGLKINFKFLRGYFLTTSSSELMAILHRIAYPELFDIQPQKSFNYDNFRQILEKLKEDRPELMI